MRNLILNFRILGESRAFMCIQCTMTAGASSKASGHLSLNLCLPLTQPAGTRSYNPFVFGSVRLVYQFSEDLRCVTSSA